MGQKIIVGLSGGVDSSVAALLLLEQGYEVEALFMKNWEEDDNKQHCNAEKDLSDATKVANNLGIKLHKVNFSHDYWVDVFDYFLTEHKKGRTPNPDVVCNQKIKFSAFLDHALDLGADKIATGHYARISQNNNGYLLKSGLDTNKDQSYFLYLLNQAQLAKSVFPLGEMNKLAVRKLAQKHGLITANKKDSTGICFIGERHFQSFLKTYLPYNKGNIVDEHSRFIKHHDGLWFYTIGQRKGLEIGGGFGQTGEPWFVADKRLDTNELVVVQGKHALLYHHSVRVSSLNWIINPPKFPLECSAKIRYRQPAQECQILQTENKQIKIVFKQKQRAITPGQSIVFYQGSICLGGGTIERRDNE